MDNRNMLCHQFVIDTTNEMKYFFDVLKNTYNIQNTSIEVISDIQELNMRIEHLKKLDTRIITKESLLKMIDYLSKTDGLMKTHPIPYIGDDNKFYFETIVIVSKYSVEKVLIDCSSNLEFALTYLKFILKHEFGHVIVETNKYSKCRSINQFFRMREIDITMNREEMKNFNEDSEDWCLLYHQDITSERLADEAVGITAEEANEMYKRYSEFKKIVLPNDINWFHKK